MGLFCPGEAHRGKEEEPRLQREVTLNLSPWSNFNNKVTQMLKIRSNGRIRRSQGWISLISTKCQLTQALSPMLFLDNSRRCTQVIKILLLKMRIGLLIMKWTIKKSRFQKWSSQGWTSSKTQPTNPPVALAVRRLRSGISSPIKTRSCQKRSPPMKLKRTTKPIFQKTTLSSLKGREKWIKTQQLTTFLWMLDRGTKKSAESY